MILPLIGQGCVITHNGAQIIGTVRKAYVNHAGQYRIHVFAQAAWIDTDFAASKVRLQAFVFDDGEVYDAAAAFKAKYSEEEIKEFDSAEISTARAVKPQVPQPAIRPRRPPPAPFAPATEALVAIARRTRRG